ncbi:hypothetical protein [Candidatus Arthromitus sp. SFB-rat-Yit]|uniref:hypothetical protein n=1 Tax=Candidatus Arthromitus sp. SFB-rat-Yit TaxID=1041504 RepID=UPI00030493EE|nr:hypothetical protein [Candidatus Arthromitus sp. SFB-rat-Yit]
MCIGINIISSTTKTLKLPIVTTPGGLKTTNLNTTSTTPASLLLQLRSNSGSGITTVLTGQGGGRPTIVHAGPFLMK